MLECCKVYKKGDATTKKNIYHYDVFRLLSKIDIKGVYVFWLQFIIVIGTEL